MTSARALALAVAVNSTGVIDEDLGKVLR